MKATDSEIFVKFEIVQFPKIHIIKNVQGKCTFIVFEQFFRCNITYSEKKIVEGFYRYLSHSKTNKLWNLSVPPQGINIYAINMTSEDQ